MHLAFCTNGIFVASHASTAEALRNKERSACLLPCNVMEAKELVITSKNIMTAAFECIKFVWGMQIQFRYLKMFLLC